MFSLRTCPSHVCAFIAPGTPGRTELESLFERLVAVGGRSAVKMLQRALDNLQTARCGDCVDMESTFRKVRDSCGVLVDLAWEKMHTGDWKKVNEAWRDLYVIACLAKVDAAEFNTTSTTSPREALNVLDVASLLGGRAFRDALEVAIGRAHDLVTNLEDGDGKPVTSRKRPRHEVTLGGDATLDEISAALPPGSLGDSRVRTEGITDGEKDEPELAAVVAQIAAKRSPVPQFDALPSLERFLLDWMVSGEPVVLRGLAKKWPAFTKWKHPEYLRRTAGTRTVPVELGKHFMHETFAQSLLPFGEFLDEYVAPPSYATSDETSDLTIALTSALTSDLTSDAARKPTKYQTGYLAQHALFDQIPCLRRDIVTPDYCALTLIQCGEETPLGNERRTGEETLCAKVSTHGGDDDDANKPGLRAVNAWLGPKGTVSPTHTDPTHNLLTQVFGKKYVRVWAPEHTDAMYASTDLKERNVSRVDPDFDCARELRTAFPKFLNAPFQDVVLEPGDALYLPPKWWHYVQSLTSSFSVSFWWM